MRGVVTRKHFLQVLFTFGIRKAVKLLVTRQQTALNLLV